MANLTSSGGKLRTANGFWSGFGYTGGPSDFEATQTQTPAAPPLQSKPPVQTTEPRPALNVRSDLVGQWRWTCCRNAHSGTFTIQEQTPEGHFYGVFGKSADDGASPFAGTFSNGAVVFTRFILAGLS